MHFYISLDIIDNNVNNLKQVLALKTRVQKRKSREEIQNSLKEANKRATRLQSQGEASESAPPTTTSENNSVMRESLEQITRKLDDIPKRSNKKEISLIDSINWTMEESRRDSLPPYPKYQGYKGL